MTLTKLIVVSIGIIATVPLFVDFSNSAFDLNRNINKHFFSDNNLSNMLVIAPITIKSKRIRKLEGRQTPLFKNGVHIFYDGFIAYFNLAIKDDSKKINIYSIQPILNFEKNKLSNKLPLNSDSVYGKGFRNQDTLQLIIGKNSIKQARWITIDDKNIRHITKADKSNLLDGYSSRNISLSQNKKDANFKVHVLTTDKGKYAFSLKFSYTINGTNLVQESNKIIIIH